MKRFTHPNLPDGVFVLPLTPGASAMFKAQRSTADQWADLPIIRALSAPAEITTAQIIKRMDDLTDPRDQIDSIQPAIRRAMSTEDLWNKSSKKR